MNKFSTSLLREKFTIRDMMPATHADRTPVIALSNRMSLPLISEDDGILETFIVRAQNMHSCARMSAYIAKEFAENGPLLTREEPFDWQQAYNAITKGYEENWNSNRWIAIYHNGQSIFADGETEHHVFLDIVEQCDSRNKGNYEKAMAMAQEAFSQAGKAVNIEYDSNVALVIGITPEEGKCGLILRAPNKTTTFNMTIKPRRERAVQISSTLGISAAFLEGVQLAFTVGLAQQKRRYELISSASSEARKGDEASRKLGRLNAAIDQFELLYQVTYRPDRPLFVDLVNDAEDYARKLLGDEIKRKVESGEDDSGQWVI